MMQATAKPRLLFFQRKYSAKVPTFLLQHLQDHVKCLQEFFEVFLVRADCDYGEVCDKYQPDLSLFESGPNLPGCTAVRISNIGACREVPRLGLLNADAWCETRAGSLAELHQWGVEHFVSIAVTAGEHTPDIADRLFVWPNFVDSAIFRDYGESKVIPVLLTGSRAPQYPWRHRIFPALEEHFPSLKCPHGGYLHGETTVRLMLQGEQYARTINASMFVPTCGTIAKEVVRKHFEIPGCRACLVTEESPGLLAAGFRDGESCIFADERDVVDKLHFLLSHPDKLNEITAAGYRLIQERHTLRQRDQILQWLHGYKHRPKDYVIAQPDPFGPPMFVERAQLLNQAHILSGGLHISLLQQANAHFFGGEFEEAERLYVRCLEYMRMLPEARFGIALCRLHRGDAQTALAQIRSLVQYTLAAYNAPEPDPVEWAYFIASLAALGKTRSARRASKHFPQLRHPELDNVRRAMALLSDEITPQVPVEGMARTCRSLHSIPERTFSAWIDDFSKVLVACGQRDHAIILTARACASHRECLENEGAQRNRASMKRRARSQGYDVLDSRRRFRLRYQYERVLRRFRRIADKARGAL